MRRRWTLLLVLAGDLLLLVSLYLPWVQTSCGFFNSQGGVPAGLPGTFDCNLRAGSSIGWTSTAALFTLLLAGVAIAAIARPRTASRLPLGLCGLLACYFGLAAGVQVYFAARQESEAQLSPASGAYVAVAAGCLLLLGAAVAWNGRLPRRRSASAIVGVSLTAALLAVLLLPWHEVARTLKYLGVAVAPGSVAATLAVCLLVVWWRDDPARRGARFGLSAAVALFAWGAASGVAMASTEWVAWVGFALAAAILALAVIGVRGSRPQLPSWRVLIAGAAAGLFAGSLFLPWQRACYGADFGPYSNTCVTAHGWTTSGSAAALLAIALAVVAFAPRRLPVSPVELAAGLGLLVGTLAFEFRPRSGDGAHVHYGYGALLGFVCAAVLSVPAMLSIRTPQLERSRVAAGLTAVVCCAGYLTIVVLPWWNVLSQRAESRVFFAPLSWLTIVGALLAIHLLAIWVRRIAGGPAGEDIVLAPLALLALAAADVILRRTEDYRQSGGSASVVVLGSLLVLLALCGWIERSGGIRSVRIPDALRVDRL